MHILFIRKLNPFFENGASANRFAGIIKELLNNGIKITMIITGGYNNSDEYKCRGHLYQYDNLSVFYSNRLFNNNIWLRRLNKYILSKFYKKRNELFIKKD